MDLLNLSQEKIAQYQRGEKNLKKEFQCQLVTHWGLMKLCQ